MPEPNYNVVHTHSVEMLIETVNEMMKKGYMPIGGIQPVWIAGPDRWEYFQSVWSPGIFCDRRLIGQI